MFTNKTWLAVFFLFFGAACAAAPASPAVAADHFAGPAPVIVSPEEEFLVYPPYLIKMRGTPVTAMSVEDGGTVRTFNSPWEVEIGNFGVVIADCVEQQLENGELVRMANYGFVSRIAHPTNILADGVQVQASHWTLTYRDGRPFLNGSEIPVGDFWAELNEDGSFRLIPYEKGSSRGACPKVID